MGIWFASAGIVLSGLIGFAIGLAFGIALWAGFMEEEEKIKKENE